MKEARRVKVNGQEAGYAEVIPPGGTKGAAPGKDDPLIAFTSQLMDSMFYVPGTKIRFGLDPLIGLVPGVGDSAGTIVSVALIGMSARYGIPRIVLARMAMNAAINGVVGVIPVGGDLFSVWFKSNRLNYDLLQKHAGKGKVSTKSDWLFVGGLIGGVLLIVGLAIAGMVTLWVMIFKLIFGG